MKILYSILKILTYICISVIAIFEASLEIPKTEKNIKRRLTYSYAFCIAYLFQFLMGLTLGESIWMSISQIILTIFWAYAANKFKNQK